MEPIVTWLVIALALVGGIILGTTALDRDEGGAPYEKIEGRLTYVNGEDGPSTCVDVGSSGEPDLRCGATVPTPEGFERPGTGDHVTALWFDLPVTGGTISHVYVVPKESE